MRIDLQTASAADAPTLGNLFQYYVHDLSELVGVDVGPDGRFATRPLDTYWSDPRRHPYLFRVDGQLAGFALVHQRSRITGDENTFDVAEFFVLRRYRRLGVGSAVAARVFDAFPGPWEVRELRANAPAIAFWRRVIGAYTGGDFQETTLDDERWRGPVQSFHRRRA